MTASKGGMAELTSLSRITFDYAILEPWDDKLMAHGVKHPADWYVWAYPENELEGPVNLTEEAIRYLANAMVDLGRVSEGLEGQKDTSGFRVSLWDLLEWIKDSGLITRPTREDPNQGHRTVRELVDQAPSKARFYQVLAFFLGTKNRHQFISVCVWISPRSTLRS